MSIGALVGFTGRKKSVQYFFGGQISYSLILKGGGGGIGYGADTRLAINAGKLNPYLNIKLGFSGGQMTPYFLGGLRFKF